MLPAALALAVCLALAPHAQGQRNDDAPSVEADGQDLALSAPGDGTAVNYWLRCLVIGSKGKREF